MLEQLGAELAWMAVLRLLRQWLAKGLRVSSAEAGWRQMRLALLAAWARRVILTGGTASLQLGQLHCLEAVLLALVLVD
jgi:hypothetical protein